MLQMQNTFKQHSHDRYIINYHTKSQLHKYLCSLVSVSYKKQDNWSKLGKRYILYTVQREDKVFFFLKSQS